MTAPDSHPLSYGQRALWFLQRTSPESTAYNFVFAARVSPPPDQDALRGALKALVWRHSSLRTTFTQGAAGPIQTIGPDPDFDFRHLETPTWDLDALGRRAADEAFRPFDLERGPMMRVCLFSGPADESLLLLVVHHIAIDFHSLALFLEELGALYRAEVTGVPASLPPAPRFVDWTNWQRELLAGPESERLWAYWQRQLRGPLPALSLPSDRARPTALTYRGASVDVTLEPHLVGELRRLCASCDTTLSTMLLAAFQVLLFRYTDQREVLVGCPVSGRGTEFERVIGFMMNTVVIRSSLAGDRSFRRLLSEVDRTVAEGLAHQHFPFPLLVERLRPDRRSTSSPIIQSLFALHDPGAQSVVPLMFGQSGVVANLGGLAFTPFRVEQRSAMMDLSLLMVDAGPSIAAAWQYRTDLFDRSTIETMARSYDLLLRDVVEAPDRPISELRLRASEDREPPPGATLDEQPDEIVLRVLAELTPGATPDASDESDSSPGVLSRPSSKADLDFGLFYFASDERAGEHDKYRLLIDGAKFADRHGLSAVWTPERHFHAFGGLYPNPSVTSAAVAACTERVGIRAGSVVLPLHNPVRVAEEWSIVDNLSDGRVGVAFASGWNEDDFVLAPENHDERREIMVQSIDVVRRLWRGEAVTLPGTRGRSLPIAIRPRPVQAELPIWLAAFGNPATFRLAGQLGANVLTHLVGQSTRELAEKIGVYRQALSASGLEAKAGGVAVMLHTFLGDDLEEVREQTRRPFIDYLKTNVGQARELAVSTGRGLEATRYGDDDVDAYLEAVFARYFGSRSLLGTPASCRSFLDELVAIGVSEIACLVDFGIEDDLVLQGLNQLTQLIDLRREAGSSALRTRGRHRTSLLYVLDPLLRPVPTGAVGDLYLGGDAVPRGFAGGARLTAERCPPDPHGDRPGGRLLAVGRRGRRRTDGSLELVGAVATERPDTGAPELETEPRDSTARELVTREVRHRVRARRASMRRRRPAGPPVPRLQPKETNE